MTRNLILALALLVCPIAVGQTITTGPVAPAEGRRAHYYPQYDNNPARTDNNLHIQLTRDGQTIVLAPNGLEERYLWPQLSPDGKQLAYCVSGHGTYVLNLDTQQMTYIGRLHAARWFDNQWLVAMDDHDNGYEVTSSTLVMTNAQGTVQQAITDTTYKATYPSVLGNRVAFTTPEGGVYEMTVKIEP